MVVEVLYELLILLPTDIQLMHQLFELLASIIMHRNIVSSYIHEIDCIHFQYMDNSHQMILFYLLSIDLLVPSGFSLLMNVDSFSILVQYMLHNTTICVNCMSTNVSIYI
jgi:hypothetical protein